MTPGDAWTIAVDIFTFGWVPVWLQMFLIAVVAVAAVGAIVGRFLRGCEGR